MNQKASPSRKMLTSIGFGIVIALAFAGWRGSDLARKSETNELSRALKKELRLTSGLVAAHISQFESEVFNVVSAEYLQRSTHTPGPTSDLNDSVFAAVGLVEWGAEGFEPLWWAVSSRAHDQVNLDWLRQSWQGWQPELKQMGRHYFLRQDDINKQPIMVFISRIVIPASSQPALAVAVFPPSAINLIANEEHGELVWDPSGVIWGYQNPSYIGSTLKTDPLVSRSTEMENNDVTDEIVPVHYAFNGENHLAYFTRLAESNLSIGVTNVVPSIANIFFRWWLSLLLAAMGALGISFAWLRWQGVEDDTLELPPMLAEQATVEPPVLRSRPKPLEFIEERESAPETELASETVLKGGDESLLQEEPMAPSPVPPVVPLVGQLSNGVSVAAALRRALAGLRIQIADEDIALREDMDAQVFVQAKSAQLQTAFEEILKNAIDALKESPVRKITIEVAAQDSYARISIRDTGSGISLDDMERIFEPFFTTKSGTSRGLGLTVVHRLMEIVGGQTKVESEVGRGTSLTLLIPVVSPAIATANLARLEPMNADLVGQLAASQSGDSFGGDLGKAALYERELPETKMEIRKARVRSFE